MIVIRRLITKTRNRPAVFEPRLTLLVAILHSALAFGPAIVPAAVHAQDTAAQSPDGETRAFNVPAGPLDAALNRFARAAGVNLTYDAALISGAVTQGLSGNYSISTGLAELLAGTGLEAVAQAGGGYSLRKAPTAPAAQESEAPPADQELPEVKVVSEVEVQARYQSTSHELPPEYAGGQVARGGRLGILGNRDMMDTPFNQTSYTSKLIQDQQANFMSDALKNDPSVSSGALPSTGIDGFFIRGFSVNNTEILFNGMVGVSPSYANSMMAESIERVEVLKGPNAMLNGMAPNGSIGGAINIIPKYAGDEPLTQLTPSYNMDSQLGGHVDVARRYGPDKKFGVRFNGVYRDGDTPIENQSRESRLAALGLDYRGERLRLSSDLGYQYQDVQGVRRFVGIAANGAVPKAPDSRRNFSNPWEFSTPEVYYGTLRGEYDVTGNLTVFAAIGGSQREWRMLETFRTINNANGDQAAGNTSQMAVKMISKSSEVGMRGSFDTGPITHQVTMGYSWFDREERRGNGPNHAFPASNIYNPTYGSAPNSALFADPDKVGKVQDLVLTSTAISDTLSILDEHIQLTLGARLQHIDRQSFSAITGALTGSYDKKAVTPMVGLVVKPWHNVSLYGNYVEGLQPGQIAPTTAANAGQIFAPYITKQYEIGIKIDSGQITTTVAFYQIALPSGFTDSGTNVFGVDGEQRHRGVDLNVFGEVMDGIRLLGGVGYVDSELTKTAGGTNNGNTGIAVPEYKLVAGAEWDTPFLKGLTLAGRVTYNSSAYLNAANTLQIPSWTRFDVGARYRIERAKGQPIVVRASIDNVFDTDYWIPGGSGELSLSEPRTFKLSATFSF